MARVAAIKGSYFGPCPAPSDALQFQVTFSVNGTLPNGYVPITYSWRNGRSATKPVTVDVKEGGASFTYTTGGQQSSTEGGVSVVWSSPGGYSGTGGPAGYSVTCEVIG